MTDHYHRTGYCSRCDRYYGQHNDGCPLAGVVPACMTGPECTCSAESFTANQWWHLPECPRTAPDITPEPTP